MSERRYQHGVVKLLHSGEEYFNALEHLIRKAEEVIYIQFYIFDLDETGESILNALLAAAERKVKVYFLVDAIGSNKLDNDFEKRMHQSGIFFRRFTPLPFPGMLQAGRRLHVKVCVADGLTATIGGINVSNRYHGVNGELPWLDYALLVEGPVAEEVENVCMQLWKRRFRRNIKRIPRLHRHERYPVRVRVSLNDWFRSRNQISTGYKRMLKKAEKEIIIIAAYFLPGKKMLAALIGAVRKGRKVTVVLTQQSDVPLVKDAIAYLYPKLLREGVEIYEFQRTILHAKACVIDDRWLSLGSHNLNNLSELMSVEMNLEVLDDKVAHGFAEELRRLINQDCRHVDSAEFRQKLSIPLKFKLWLSYTILALIQRIMYLFFRRETFPAKGKK